MKDRVQASRFTTVLLVACVRVSDVTDAPLRVVVRPPIWLRRLSMQANVRQEPPSQIANRGEFTARDHVPFNVREAELLLIEPRTVGRREVEHHVGIRGLLDRGRLRLVGGDGVEDHGNLLVGAIASNHLRHERQQVVGACVTGRGHPGAAI